MKSFILAILNNWHVFLQTKLVTVFRNIFILYNKKLLAMTSIEDIRQLYGFVSITTCSTFNLLQLYNDLDYVNQSTNIVYLHKSNIYKKQYNQFIDINIDESNTVEYTYEEAFNKLLEFVNNTLVKNNAIMKDTAEDAGSEDDKIEEEAAAKEEEDKHAVHKAEAARPTINQTDFETLIKHTEL
jgi:hypothetical protein